MAPPCASGTAVPGKPNRRARRLKTQLDDGARERRHPNDDGLHGVVLFDLPLDSSRSPSDSRRGSDASQRRRSRSARSGSGSSPPRCTLPFGTDTASATRRARDRSWLGTQPTKSHARAVTGTATFYTWSSCSTSAGSLEGPARFGRVAATSPEDRAFGLSVDAAEVCSPWRRRAPLREKSALSLAYLEREKGFEPSTSTLARWHSTTELLPQCVRNGIARSIRHVNDTAWRRLGPRRASTGTARGATAGRDKRGHV